MKFQSLETRVALLTVMTSLLLLLVTPSSADRMSCLSWSVDIDVAYGSGCSTNFENLYNFPSLMRSYSLEGGDMGDSVLLDDTVFEDFFRMESLSLSRMIVSRIEPCALCSSPRLRSVALDNVTVERLPPDLLANSSKLREFRATGCGLSGVPEELFAGNPELRSVDLSGNALTELPSRIFASNGNLRKVSLAGNRLTELPVGLFDWNPRLEEVWLDHNALTSLPEGLFVVFNGTLSLEGNPLGCDCALRSVVTQLETQLGWTVRLPEGCLEEMVHASCSSPSSSSSSSSCSVLVTWSLYLGVVGWTIWWQVAKGQLDT